MKGVSRPWYKKHSPLKRSGVLAGASSYLTTMQSIIVDDSETSRIVYTSTGWGHPDWGHDPEYLNTTHGTNTPNSGFTFKFRGGTKLFEAICFLLTVS
jgi:hypothetical protein